MFDPKTIQVQKTLVLDQKTVRLKKVLVRKIKVKKFGSKKLWIQKICCPKILRVQQILS